MSIEMTMNFNHMVSWSAAYADFRLAEQNARKETKEEKILAMKSMRSGFEKMVTILAEHAGITDDMVRQVKCQMNKDDNRVDLYGRILALCAYGVIDAESGKNYNTIRVLGNQGVHDNVYLNASTQQVSKDMEMMYRLLHRETNLFANKYMKTMPVLAGGKNRNIKPAGRNGGFAAAFIAVACLVLYVLFVGTAMKAQRDNYEENAQRMYDNYQESVERMHEEYAQAVEDMYETQQERTQQCQEEAKERYEEGVKEMQDKYQQSVQEMQEQQAENIRRIRGY